MKRSIGVWTQSVRRTVGGVAVASGSNAHQDSREEGMGLPDAGALVVLSHGV
jgi:hypothetical protein